METSETSTTQKKWNLNSFLPFGCQIEKNQNPFLVYRQGDLSKWVEQIPHFRGLPLQVRHAWLLSASRGRRQRTAGKTCTPKPQRWGFLLCEHQWGGAGTWPRREVTHCYAGFLTPFFFLLCLIEAFYLGILVYVYKKTRIWTLDYKGPCSHTMTITLRFSLREFRLSLLLMFIVVCFMGVYNRIAAGAGSSCEKPSTKTAKFQTGRAHRQFPAILECGSVFGAVFSKTSQPIWLLLAASALSKVRVP